MDSIVTLREIARLLTEARDCEAHDRDLAAQLRDAARITAERAMDDWEAEAKRMGELAGAA